MPLPQLHNDRLAPAVIPGHPHTRYRQDDAWFIKFDGDECGPYKTEREALLLRPMLPTILAILVKTRKCCWWMRMETV
jgi:hypothetical protein